MQKARSVERGILENLFVEYKVCSQKWILFHKINIPQKEKSSYTSLSVCVTNLCSTELAVKCCLHWWRSTRYKTQQWSTDIFHWKSANAHGECRRNTPLTDLIGNIFSASLYESSLSVYVPAIEGHFNSPATGMTTSCLKSNWIAPTWEPPVIPINFIVNDIHIFSERMRTLRGASTRNRH